LGRAIAILLALPWGFAGGGFVVRGVYNDVYFQIGLLTVLGLTTKNAFLIVQFAWPRWKKVMAYPATLEGKLRLRPT
jgi:HAE1 family hydrophobic/amphiphilic exporter-1